MLKCYDMLQKGEGGCNHVLHNTGLVIIFQTFRSHAALRFVKKIRRILYLFKLTVIKKILKTIIFRYKTRFISLYFVKK